MPNVRDRIRIPEQDYPAIIESGRTLQVASNGLQGYPHLVAMWYAVVDSVITFTTYTKSQKIRNLQRDPKITVMLESGVEYNELKGLVIEGEAELIIGDAEYTARVMAFVGAKHAGLPAPAADAPVAATPQSTKRCVVRVHPTHTRSWDHGGLTGGGYGS